MIGEMFSKAIVGIGCPSFALIALDQWSPATWIGCLAKLGLVGALATMLVAETIAVIWLARKAVARSEKTDAIAVQSATAMQANADAQKELATAVREDSATTKELALHVRNFGTVIERCSK